MNIFNKFADSLGMPVVNLNIRMCLFVFAPENQLLITEFGPYAFLAWSEERILHEVWQRVLNHSCSNHRSKFPVGFWEWMDAISCIDLMDLW